MSIADALSAAQEAVAKAEGAASVDIGAAEATAVLGTAQATVAYQLAMQILQNKVVDLAPVLIALEVAAINEGIAAYLAEQELSLSIEKDVEAKTVSAFEQVEAAFKKSENSLHGAE
jgi:hypothetical protein